MKRKMLLPRIPVFNLRHAASLFLGAAVVYGQAAIKIWDGGGADNFWQTPANWDANTVPVAGDSLVFTNTTRLNSTNNFPAATTFAGINFLAPAGAFTLGGNAITLGGNIGNNQPVLTETISLPLALNANRNVNVGSNASLTIGGVISGAGFGLSKSGQGLLTLSGANTYDGSSTLHAGTLSISADGNLGTAPGAATAGNIVVSNGTLRSTANLTLNANRGIALGPTSGSGQGRLDQNSGATLTYRGVMANNGGTGGLTKGGFGTFLISAPNTYTGPTIVKNGALNVDLNDGGSPANDVISSSSALTLGGENAGIGTANFAALNVTASATKTQSFAGTTIDIGPALVRATNANVVLGTLSHAAGANLVFVTNGASTLNTTSPNENGIIGGWAVTGSGTVFNNITMGTEFATENGTGDVGPYGGYSVHLNANGNLNTYVSNAVNLRINATSSGDVTVNTSGAGTTTDVNSINLSATRAFSVIVGANNTLRLGRYGGIFKSDFVNNITWALGTGTTGGGNGTQDVGTLTAGGAPNTPGEINFVMNNNASQSQGSLNVEGRITDNGSGPVTVIKSGPQAMKLRGHNTFSGGMYVLGGRMQLAGSEIGTGNPDGGGTGKIVVMPGAYLFLSGTGDFGDTGLSVSNLIQIAGNGTQQEPVGAIRFGNGVRISGPVELIGDARIGGGNLANVNETGISGKISGDFGLDLGSVQTINSFFSLLNPANDWSGTTTFNARNTATVNQVNNGASEVIPHGFGKGNVVMNGNTSTGTIQWDLNGFNETINGLETAANNPVGCVIQNSSGANVSTLTVGANDQSGTFGGSLNDVGGTLALTKINGGRLTLAGVSSFTGPTIINGGTLAVSGAGSIASSTDILVSSGTALDVADVASDFVAANTVRVPGGTIVGDSASLTIPTLSFTNGGFTIVADTGKTNAVVTTLTTGGPTNYINISAVAGVSGYPAEFTVLKYSTLTGAGNNFGLGEVPNSATIGYVSNHVASGRIVLVLLDGPKPLTWTGNLSWDWDIDVTTNWIAFKGTVNETNAAFNTADSTFFDDTGLTNVINLVSAVEPGGITVSNETVNYSLVGSGSVSGLGGILKQGAGSLTLANTGNSSFRGGVAVNGGSVTFATANAIAGGVSISSGTTAQLGTNGNSGNLPAGNVGNEGTLIFNRGTAAYTVGNAISGNGAITKSDAGVLTLSGVNNSFLGAVSVAAGTLLAGSGTALGTADGVTTISSGATLDVGGQQLNGEPIVVSGTGVGGLGAIINTGADNLNALGNVTLAGHTTFGGRARYDIRGGLATLSTSGNPYNLTKIGTNQFSLVGATVDAALADISVGLGSVFAAETTTTSLGNPANTLTVNAGGTLQFFNTYHELANARAWNKIFVLNGNATTNTINNASGTNVVDGLVTLTGNCVFNVGGTLLVFNNAIGGSGSLNKIGTATLILNGTNTYAGATTNTAGTLIINGENNGGGLLTNAPGTTLAGRGKNSGPVVLATNVTFLPGGAGVAGTFASGALTLNNGDRLTFDLAGTDFNNVFPVNDRVAVTGNLTLNGVSTNTLVIGPVGTITNGQFITLFQYTGTLTGNTNNLRVIAPSGYSFSFVDTTTTPGEIQIKVEASPSIITWTGQNGVNPTFWDVATTTNWLKGGVGKEFLNFDATIFDDSGLTTTVNLATNVTPSSITMNNNSLNYTFSGIGKLTGATRLDVNGSGSLTIANSGSNDFTGPVNVNGGLLRVGAGGADGNLGSGPITNLTAVVFNRSGTLTVNSSITGGGSLTNAGSGVVVLSGANSYEGSLTVASGTIRAGSATALGTVGGTTVVEAGASLDVGGQTLNTEAVTVSGAGVGGNGAIINNGGDSLNAMGNVTLAGDTTFGGPARWDIRGGAATLNTGGSPFNLTKVGTNQFSLVGVLVDGALANIDVQAGTFAAETTTTSLGNPANTFMLAAGATFQLFNSTTPFDKIFLLSGNGIANTINVSSGTANTIVGPVTLTGLCRVNTTAANALTMTGLMGGTGSLTKAGTGSLSLINTLSYAGDTAVVGGSLIVSSTAVLTNSPLITVGAGALLDVTGQITGPTLALRSGQTLAGHGNINGSVLVEAGATISPGTSGGVLTVTNDVTLQGTALMELNKAANTNDRIRSVLGNITFGGTLVITNIGGTLVGGESFKLFDALVGTYPGSFTGGIQLPLLGPGLAWNVTQLAVNGTISVTGTLTPPTIGTVGQVGANFQFSGTGGVPNGPYVVVTSTNVALPVVNWTRIATNSFDGTGAFTFSTPIDSNVVGAFYRLLLP